MFKFFKSNNQTKSEKMEALIKKQTDFSINAIDLHTVLKKLAPDKSLAIFHAFIFNNWLSYYFLSRHICSALPATSSDLEVKAAKEDVQERIIRSAQSIGLPKLESKFSISTKKYYPDFLTSAKFEFFAYDDSVKRHQTPDWVSAAIALSSKVKLPGPYDDESVDLLEWNKNNEAHQREVLQIFKGLEGGIRPDVADYIKTK